MSRLRTSLNKLAQETFGKSYEKLKVTDRFIIFEKHMLDKGGILEPSKKKHDGTGLIEGVWYTTGKIFAMYGGTEEYQSGFVRVGDTEELQWVDNVRIFNHATTKWLLVTSKKDIETIVNAVQEQMDVRGLFGTPVMSINKSSRLKLSKSEKIRLQPLDDLVSEGIVARGVPQIHYLNMWWPVMDNNEFIITKEEHEEALGKYMFYTLPDTEDVLLWRKSSGNYRLFTLPGAPYEYSWGFALNDSDYHIKDFKLITPEEGKDLLIKLVKTRGYHPGAKYIYDTGVSYRIKEVTVDIDYTSNTWSVQVRLGLSWVDICSNSMELEPNRKGGLPVLYGYKGEDYGPYITYGCYNISKEHLAIKLDNSIGFELLIDDKPYRVFSEDVLKLREYLEFNPH